MAKCLCVVSVLCLGIIVINSEGVFNSTKQQINIMFTYGNYRYICTPVLRATSCIETKSGKIMQYNYYFNCDGLQIDNASCISYELLYSFFRDVKINCPDGFILVNDDCKPKDSE